MITGLAKLLGRGALGIGKGLGHGAFGLGKGAFRAGVNASAIPAWYARQFMKNSWKNKIANLGNLGMFYKRNKRRWHDALNAGELIHPYNY